MFCLFIPDMLHVAPRFGFHYWESFLTVMPSFLARGIDLIFNPGISARSSLNQRHAVWKKSHQTTPDLRFTKKVMYPRTITGWYNMYMIPENGYTHTSQHICAEWNVQDFNSCFTLKGFRLSLRSADSRV